MKTQGLIDIIGRLFITDRKGAAINAQNSDQAFRGTPSSSASQPVRMRHFDTDDEGVPQNVWFTTSQGSSLS